MAMVTTAFCTHCGRPLDGTPCSCRAVQPPSPLGPARRRLGRRLSGGLAALLALGAGAAFAVDRYDGLQSAVRAAEQGITSLEERNSALQEQLDVTTSEAGLLSDRLSKLEAAEKEAPASTRVARAAQPSVFTIVTEHGSGSGFVATSQGGRSRLVTNFHVIADGYVNGVSRVTVQRGSQKLVGEVVDASEASDLAVIEVDKKLPALAWSTKRLPSGAPVFALGSPLGLGGTVTSGIVSAYRSLEDVPYLQFSAPISPGNSGGPVLDSEGRVVGVTVQKMVGGGAEGLGFAVPSDRACDALAVC